MKFKIGDIVEGYSSKAHFEVRGTKITSSGTEKLLLFCIKKPFTSRHGFKEKKMLDDFQNSENYNLISKKVSLYKIY